jgi:hypothetical protein
VKAAAERRVEHAQAEQAVRTYGLPVDVAPEDALLEEVHRTAGHVAYLNGIIGDFSSKDELRQWASTGEEGGYWRQSVWVELYRHERAHLVAVCKAAISAGIEERRVQLAEKQGELVAELLRVAIDAAQLSPQQSARAYEAIRGHLTRVA